MRNFHDNILKRCHWAEAGYVVGLDDPDDNNDWVVHG